MVKKAIIAYADAPDFFLEHIAKFDLADIGFEGAPRVAELKQLNPNIIVLGYLDLIGRSSASSDWNVVNAHENWFLHDINGNRLQEKNFAWFLMDISNDEYREHYASRCLAMFPYGFDGVFADDCWTALFRDAFTVDASLVPDWNYKVNQYIYWQVQMREFLSYIKMRIGNKILLYNGPSPIYIDVADGRMREGFAFFDVEWRRPIDDINDLAQISATGKYYMAFSDTDVDNEKNFLYGFCCFLLGVNGPNAYFSWLNIWTIEQGKGPSRGYYPQMDYDFGNPRAPYYLVSGQVYGRDFDHYKVFVNLSSTTPETFMVEDVSYTLQPKTGLLVPWEAPPKIFRAKAALAGLGLLAYAGVVYAAGKRR